MEQEPTSPKYHQNESIGNSQNQAIKVAPMITARQPRLQSWNHIFTGAWTLIAAMATAANLGLVQLMEYQAQSLFFELRGAVDPPTNVVILAIDEESLSVPKQYYQTDPQQYAYFAPLQAWPWKRSAYAQAIERLMAAGARSVALDVILTTPSSYGAADDRRLAQVLHRYPGRVTLAAVYEQVEMLQGSLTQLAQPERLFWTQPISIGFVNFPLEIDGKVHRFSSEFPKLLAQKEREKIADFDAIKVAIPSFDEAAVAAAELNYSTAKAEHIYFYGATGTFKQIPFWYVLDPVNWNTFLQQGKFFKDKIVIVGATAASLQDFHGTPFSQSWLYPEQMSGVEIHANAIATLLEGRAIKQVFPNPKAQGLFVLLLMSATGFLLTIFKQASTRFIGANAIAITWCGFSYFCFVYGKLILPTALPVVAIALSGFSYVAVGGISDSWKKRRLRRNSQPSESSFPVEEIVSQQDDTQERLRKRELVTIGRIIGGHYKIIKVLASGGFSETYISEDWQRPGNPRCVVKQLSPANNHPKHLQLARRLFKLEAETLEKLGTHAQIPRLFAYFEEDEEFYLVQELIVGHSLSRELRPGKPILEAAVIQILLDLLQTLQFVHSNNVIHRDIKPSNIIRRHSDGKLVLIDFGAVKEVSTQILEHEGQTRYTVGIGTLGYAPNEQCAGRAKFTSDIYAVGMTAIKALTGLAPHELEVSETGEILWTHKTQVSPQLSAILSKMVLYDFTMRYQSASEVLKALEELVSSTTSLDEGDLSTNTSSTDDLDTPTALWLGVTEEVSQSSSKPPQLPQ